MIHSFLMIGQSNMAGRGFVREVAPISDSNIKMLRNGRWQTMAEPINYDRPFAGIGPAASFAYAWRKDNPDDVIGLIPAADGGSRLDDWMPGGALFDHAVMQTRLALRTSKLDGILWHQGESDCGDVPAYEGKLILIMEELRRQLNVPDIPLIVGGIGNFVVECPLHDYFVHTPEMNQTIKHYALNTPDCYFVTADGLTCNPDHLHFNAASQRLFGLRYYAAFHDKRHVCEALPDEQEMLEEIRSYIAKTPEEKAADLKKLLESGSITRQAYNHMMDDLIRDM